MITPLLGGCGRSSMPHEEQFDESKVTRKLGECRIPQNGNADMRTSAWKKDPEIGQRKEN